MKRCKNCGRKLEDTATYCISCYGHDIEEINSSDTVKTEEEEIKEENISSPDNKKKKLIIGISIIAGIIIIAVLWKLISFSSNVSGYTNLAKYSVEKIERHINEGEYFTAVSELKNYKKQHQEDTYKYYKYLPDDMKGDSVYSKYMTEIEETIYQKIMTANDDETKEGLCIDYLDIFESGQYSNYVESVLAEVCDTLAPQRIKEAKQYINSGDYYSAVSTLNTVAYSSYVSEKYAAEANTYLERIKPITAILGTWHKATGVSYTFEEDGHMSTSLSQSYNKSAGTALDGIEVTTLLGDIEDFGRPIHGGRWQYVDTLDGIYCYTLFYNGSNFYCYLEGRKLGIILASGLGEMSYLSK